MELNLYMARYISLQEYIEGVAIIAANNVELATTLLNTTGSLKDYKPSVTELVIIPGSIYNGEPVVIKEYLFPVN